MIEVKNVSKYFGSVKAVDNLSFELNQGEVVGFLGPNGAGKTTTMRILTGYLPANSGTCQVGGHEIATHSFEARKKMGYLPESAPLYGDMEVSEYLRYLGILRKCHRNFVDKRLKEVVEICGLRDAIGKKISTLSKGYRQRTGLAQALLHDPEILILDEPTVGLDPNQIAEIRSLIREIGQKKTILLSTHILSEVEQVCKRVIIIADGKIVGQGTPEELVHQTHGSLVYHVAIRGSDKEMIEGFKNLKHFNSLITKESLNDVGRFEITLDSREDLSEEIFKLVISKKGALLELRKEAITLEEVFKKLTL